MTDEAADSQGDVEEEGPLRAVVLLRSRLRTEGDRDLYELTTRLFIHAGEPAVRAEHVFADIGGPEIPRVRNPIPLSAAQDLRVRVGGELCEMEFAVREGEVLRLLQRAPSVDPPRDFSYAIFRIDAAGRREELRRGGRARGA